MLLKPSEMVSNKLDGCLGLFLKSFFPYLISRSMTKSFFSVLIHLKINFEKYLLDYLDFKLKLRHLLINYS